MTIAVPEEVFTSLHMLGPATVRFEEYPGKTFSAVITELNPGADPQGRQFTVRVTLENQQNLFKPGMFARVALETEREPHTVVVPREAVQHDEDGSAYVMVFTQTRVDDKRHMLIGTANKRPVTLGTSNPAFIQVLNGVQLGELLVTMSANALKDSSGVSVPQARGAQGDKASSGGMAPSGADGNASPQGGAPGQSPLPHAASSVDTAAPGMPAAPNPQGQTPASTGRHHLHQQQSGSTAGGQ